MKGQAEIRIRYDQGEITVFHTENDQVLASWQEKEDNSDWKTLWDLIEQLVRENNGYRVNEH